MDYDIQLNDVIQLIIRVCKQSELGRDVPEDKQAKDSTSSIISVETESKYYKIGDLIDVRFTEDDRAWYEAKIIKIQRLTSAPDDQFKEKTEEGDLVFTVRR